MGVEHDLKLAPLTAGDEQPTPAELAAISCFEGMKKVPNFEKFANNFVLRQGYRGRVICEQGAAGTSAFYVLTKSDVRKLRGQQLAAIEQALSAAPEQGERTAAGAQRELLAQQQTLKAELAALGSDSERETNAESPVLSVYLNLPGAQRKFAKRGLMASIKRFFGETAHPKRREKTTASIPIDAPAVLSSEKPSAKLKEGDLFGEMSCMYRTPRSATVVVDEPCYVLEMLRNILDFLHKDPAQKERMDRLYRERVLNSHLQQLSFFQGIEYDTETVTRLRAMVKLEQFEAGDVVFEEHEAADAIYIVRSGMVKVLKNVGCRIQSQDFSEPQWSLLASELNSLESNPTPLAALVRAGLEKVSPRFAQAIGTQLSTNDRETLLAELNQLVCEATIPTQLGKSTSEVIQKVNRREFTVAMESFPEKTENWSQLERRIFHRLCLEACCPLGMPSRAIVAGPMQTLNYLGQGDVLGEMGVVLDIPRSATCVAYDHPDGRHGMRLPDSRTGGVPSLLELVRIDRADFDELRKRIPALNERVAKIIESRQARSRDRRETATATSQMTVNTPEMERLGLIQGQKLMLIDLDRCTRCGACVEACVAAHDDGNTRLYLDGPRFGNYLVPLSCRKCQDPVCLIGCPVGAINRGDNGEIVVRDWCIGCSLCADQCPYGSIQMTDLFSGDEPARPDTKSASSEHSHAEAKSTVQKAIVCDLCSSTTLGQEACVYACPHDAALRANAATYFPLR